MQGSRCKTLAAGLARVTGLAGGALVLAACAHSGDGGAATLPPWLSARLTSAGGAALEEVRELQYQGRTAYLLVPGCCDRYITLHDARGTYLCAPGGGITGRGDGRCPDALAESRHMRTVWSRPGQDRPSRVPDRP